MGRQVPDISPEGIAEVTRLYRESVDKEAVRQILSEDFTTEVLTKWRESAKLHKVGTARLLGMTKRAYVRIENEQAPITNHFREALRTLIKKLDVSGFDFNPSDRTKMANKYRSTRSNYIPLDKMAHKGEWKKCANPNCKKMGKWFYSTHKNQKYCSDYCKDNTSHRKKIDGVITKNYKQPRDSPPIIVKCPHCKSEFGMKGHIISANSRRYTGSHTHKSNGQADHDEQEQAHEEVSSLLSDGLLPGDKESIQSDEQVR